MKIPSKLISAYFVVCERVLHEADGIYSTIRHVDVFYVNLNEEIPLATRHIHISGLFRATFRDVDGAKYALKFELERPNGKRAILGSADAELNAKSGLDPSIPRGIATELQLNVDITSMGTYYIIAYIDDIEVVRTPFSIMPPLPQSEEDPQN